MRAIFDDIYLPLFRTLIYGDKEAGFSLFSPDEGLDTGNLYYKESTPVDPNDTVDTLYNRFMYPKGIEAMVCSYLLRNT